jgi:hypothetical protein
MQANYLQTSMTNYLYQSQYQLLLSCIFPCMAVL